MTDLIFGTVRGLPHVEKAYLNTLETWMPEMLSLVEREHGMPAGTLHRPLGSNSYRGGLDFELMRGDELPLVIVTVTPAGNSERAGSIYASWFEVTVGMIVATESEHESRMMAGYCGLAVQASIAQHGSIGGLADQTEMTVVPNTEFIDPDQRLLMITKTTFQSFVSDLVDAAGGPKVAAPPQSPQYPGQPDQPWNDQPVVTSTPVVLDPQSPQ